VPLETTVQGRTGQPRNGGLESIEAVVQRQQRLLAEGDSHRFLFLSENGGARLGPHPCIVDGASLPPLSHSLRVDSVLPSQTVQSRLTILYRSTHCRCRAGASVEYLSHNASHDGNCSYSTPSHCGTKHLRQTRNEDNARLLTRS
jgi:hypothetical protein